MRGRAFRPYGGDQVAVLAGDDSRSDACFADEVIIDFPSMVPAVNRIRHAFLAAEQPDALHAAIELSPREAREGVTVPLDVPVRCTCRQCGGRGESWSESCPGCRGSGSEFLKHQLQVTLPAGVPDGARFHFTVTPRHHPPTRIELEILLT
jgi:hypothetical protein